MDNTKISIFAPLIFGVLHIVSFGIMTVTSIMMIVDLSVPGGSVSILVATILFVVAFAVWKFSRLKDSGELPGSLQASGFLNNWLTVSSTVFALLLLGSSLLFFGSKLAMTAMLLTGTFSLFLLGIIHRIKTQYGWYDSLQTVIPLIQGVLVATSIMFGCLAQSMMLVPFVVLLILDSVASIVRYQLTDTELRRNHSDIVSNLRRSANIAMLLRFVMGTVIVALLIGIRPTLLPLAITSLIVIDRLLLQVSVAALKSSEQSDNLDDAVPIST